MAFHAYICMYVFLYSPNYILLIWETTLELYSIYVTDYDKLYYVYNFSHYNNKTVFLRFIDRTITERG